MNAICWCDDCTKRRLGKAVWTVFDDCEQQQAISYAYAANAKAATESVAQDAVVEANRKLLLERSNFGIAKYGVTLAGSGLTRRQLLQHALEEALDLANYLQAELMREVNENGKVESSKSGA